MFKGKVGMLAEKTVHKNRYKQRGQVFYTNCSNHDRKAKKKQNIRDAATYTGFSHTEYVSADVDPCLHGQWNISLVFKWFSNPQKILRIRCNTTLRLELGSAVGLLFDFDLAHRGVIYTCYSEVSCFCYFLFLLFTTQ